MSLFFRWLILFLKKLSGWWKILFSRQNKINSTYNSNKIAKICVQSIVRNKMVSINYASRNNSIILMMLAWKFIELFGEKNTNYTIALNLV